MTPLQWISAQFLSISNVIGGLPIGWRILAIAVLAVITHLIVRGLSFLGEWVLTRGRQGEEPLLRRYPKIATLTTLIVSTSTFVIYFGAVGLVLRELGVSLTAYLASASVIGLAVGFGLQGLVQDIVIGLTLIFSDAINVGDMADVSGQSGRIRSMGLRFTVLENLHGQQIFIPNRSINQINRYRNGYIRAYVDIQVPESVEKRAAHEIVQPVIQGFYRQHKAILISSPENMGLHRAGEQGWSYLRIKLRLWPGQGSLVETTLKQRLLSRLREREPGYAEWMITITYRAETDRLKEETTP